MKIARTIRVVLIATLALSLGAPAQTPKKPESAGPLPASFAGWQRDSDRVSRDPVVADPANPALLKEAGFTDFELATYAREGRRLEIKGARFADAGGAYAAFTFYRQPEMQTQAIGDQGASQGRDVLFYRGQLLIFARLDSVTAMSAAELRELASLLPKPLGSAANLPTLPGYLPKPGLQADSVKYVTGPAALAQAHVSLTPDEVRFDQGAEVVAARCATDSGIADLVLISYPTPQIATERARALEAIAHAAPAADVQQAVRRSGPIVALASGRIAASDARKLVEAVHYDATVTWNEATSVSPRDNVGSLIIAALALCGIVLLLALVAGIAFGGFRILMKRWFPDRVFDRSADVEIIRLNIRE